MRLPQGIPRVRQEGVSLTEATVPSADCHYKEHGQLLYFQPSRPRWASNCNKLTGLEATTANSTGSDDQTSQQHRHQRGTQSTKTTSGEGPPGSSGCGDSTDGNTGMMAELRARQAQPAVNPAEPPADPAFNWDRFGAPFGDKFSGSWGWAPCSAHGHISF